MSAIGQYLANRNYGPLLEVERRGGQELIDYYSWAPYAPATSTSVYTAVNGFGALTEIDPTGGGVALFCSSASAADTDVNFLVEGLGPTGLYQSAVGATDGADGQTKTAIDATKLFTAVFRTTITGTKNNVGSLNIYEDDTVTAGVPDTQAKRKDLVIALFGQSQNGYYRVPTGKRAIMLQWAMDGDTFALLTCRLNSRKVFGDVYVTREMREGIPPSMGDVGLQHTFDAGEDIKFTSMSGAGAQSCLVRARLLLEDAA